MSGDESFTMDDVLDASNVGPEPSEEYIQALSVLDNVVRDCMYVSKRAGGLPSPTSAHFFASVLFTVLVTRGVSLVNLAPHSPWANKMIEHWDYSSLTGIVRTMVEIRVAYFYLCHEQCTEDEWYCRWNLFNLHDCCSRIRLFEALGATEEVEGFRVQADELRDRLRANSFFMDLDPKRHKKLLHGQTAYLFPLEEIAERAGIAIGSFRWLYVLFSAHVHSLPMSFYRMGGDNPERGRGLPSPVEEGYSTLCLSLASVLLTATRDEFSALFDEMTEEPEYPTFDDEAEAEVTDALDIGGSTIVPVSDGMKFEIQRLSETSYQFRYLRLPGEELVLERVEDEETGTSLKWFDPYYWRFLLNGQPATESDLSALEDRPYMIKVDHADATIKFIG